MKVPLAVMNGNSLWGCQRGHQKNNFFRVTASRALK